jgi:Ser/Thr protein kinase RdoA (MazF antagonist)
MRSRNLVTPRLQVPHGSSTLFAGIENLSFDRRPFDPSPKDIQRLCRFFSIGKLKHFKKEHGILIAHSNFFVFAVTTRGEYALKFYPADASRSITIEYAVNRFLTKRHFPTPLMHAGTNGQPCTPSTGCLATCFTFIKGRQPWGQINQQSTITRLNAAMLSLKNLLSMTQRRIRFMKQEDFMTAATTLTQASRAAAPFSQKELIHSSLLDACRTFKRHQSLFTRQCLHNDATLTNFLVDKKNVYVLDLFHVQEDYILSDLANLVISCLFLKTPARTTRAIVEDYFTQHEMGPHLLPVLNTLVKVGLVREYLKSVQREKPANLSAYPPADARVYRFHLSARQKAIAAVLKKMNDPSRFMI